MTDTQPLVHCVRKRQLSFLGMSFVSLKKGLSEDMLSIYHHMAKGDLDVHVPPTNLTSNVC